MSPSVTIDPAKDLVLSYSSLETFNSCPRKFELYKVRPMEAERENSPALSQGSAVGCGYAAALEGATDDEVLYQTWLNYYPPLEDNVRSFSKAHVIVQALRNTPIKLENQDDPGDWELAKFEGKPATELSFAIRLNESMVYVGYLDAVMYSPSTGRYRPLELKTSSLAEENLEVNFKNSTQGLAYALILDTIVGQIQKEFTIHYRVAQVFRSKSEAYRPKVHDFFFVKNHLDRLEWLIDISLQAERIQRMEELEMYPRRGSSCLAWNRPCKFSGLCNLTTYQPAPTPEAKEYQFYFDLNDLIQQALELVQNEE